MNTGTTTNSHDYRVGDVLEITGAVGQHKPLRVVVTNTSPTTFTYEKLHLITRIYLWLRNRLRGIKNWFTWRLS